jgi:hypothetical protein
MKMSSNSSSTEKSNLTYSLIGWEGGFITSVCDDTKECSRGSEDRFGIMGSVGWFKLAYPQSTDDDSWITTSAARRYSGPVRRRRDPRSIISAECIRSKAILTRSSPMTLAYCGLGLSAISPANLFKTRSVSLLAPPCGQEH